MENRKSISYSFEDIKRYRQGLMSREEMHAFEKASMEDPFLADALEGYMNADMTLAEEHLGNIKDRITEKEEKKEQAVVVPMQRKSFGMWRVAAMVIVIAGAGLITYKVLDNKKTATQDGGLAKVTPQDQQPTQGNINAGLATDSNKNNGTDINKNGREKQIDSVSLGNVTSTYASTPKTPEKDKKETHYLYNQTDSKKDAALRDEVAENKNNGAVIEEVTTAAVPPKNRNTEAGAKAKVATSNQFRGTILNADNEPVANANLRLDNSRKEVVTDDAGNFTLTAKDTIVNATITNGSFANTRFQLRANENNTINLGTIQMKQDADFEKTVSVVGLGSKKARIAADTTANNPEGGWESFEDYVSRKLSSPDKRKKEKADTAEYSNSAELEFLVDATGKVVKVKVISSTNAAKTKQLIEAIKRGPKWTSTNTTTRILIKY